MIREILILLLLIFFIPTITLNFDSIDHFMPFSIELNSYNHLTIKNATEKIETKNIKAEINPDNQDVKNYFKKVANVPFKADYYSTKPKKPIKFWKDNFGDCDDKSTAFADYLYKLGAEDIKIVTINHESNKYAHACVMWEGRIFDATAEPAIYDMEPDRYFKFLEKQGFKLRVTHPYEPI